MGCRVVEDSMNTKTLLALSVVLNLVLTVVVFSRNRPAPALEATAPAGTLAPRSATTMEPTQKAAAAPQTGNKQFDWRAVESADYRRYIANLRSIGCPEETIRDIITADVNKLFEARKNELITAGNTNKFEFWKGGNILASMLGNTMSEEKIKQQQELSKEKRALLKELLGIEPEEKMDLSMALNPYDTLLDFIPASKRTQLLELEQKYAAKQMKHLGRGGVPDAEDAKAMKEAQKEKEAEMASILSPQEKEDYDLRLSQTATMMRMQLGDFEASEQEFRNIFKLRKQFDEEYSLLGMASQDPAERDKRRVAQTELDAQIKSTLGPARFVEYKRNQDVSYQGLVRVIERENLPKESAVRVFEMKKIAEENAAKVRANSALSEEQRNETLAAIQAETERSVGDVLGAKGLKSYQTGSGGIWLRNLRPRPAPRPVQAPAPAPAPVP